MSERNLYFGCVGRVGHYVYVPGDHGPVTPHFMRGRKLTWTTICDGGLMDCNREEQIEGVATWSHIKGYSIVSFWDRTVDSRFGSSSSFLVRGMHSFSEVIEAAREVFPSIFKRFKFNITLIEKVPA